MKTFADIACPGIGALATYEPGRPIEEVARELGIGDVSEIIKLASNENSLGPSPLALKAMQSCARAMHRYPDGDAFYLRRAIGRKLGVDPACIVVGNGSNELLELAAHVFLQPGTNIVMADRAFVVYRLLAAMMQAGVKDVPMKKYTHDLDAMLAAIDGKTRIVFVANPNNPTGTMVNAKTLDHFIRAVPDHVVVALDEAYIDMIAPSAMPDTLRYVSQPGRKVMLFRSFSKTYGLAGLRIGYGIMPRDAAALFNRVRQPFNVNAMALAAAEAALGDTRHVARTRKLVKDGLAFFAREFKRMGLPFVPSVANFVLVEVGKGRQVFQAMQREKVIVRPMDGYGLPSFIRITVGTGEENRKCVKALTRALAAA